MLKMKLQQQQMQQVAMGRANQVRIVGARWMLAKKKRIKHSKPATLFCVERRRRKITRNFTCKFSACVFFSLYLFESSMELERKNIYTMDRASLLVVRDAIDHRYRYSTRSDRCDCGQKFSTSPRRTSRELDHNSWNFSPQQQPRGGGAELPTEVATCQQCGELRERIIKHC